LTKGDIKNNQTKTLSCSGRRMIVQGNNVDELNIHQFNNGLIEGNFIRSRAEIFSSQAELIIKGNEFCIPLNGEAAITVDSNISMYFVRIYDNYFKTTQSSAVGIKYVGTQSSLVNTANDNRFIGNITHYVNA
jgi:hypothetical protein